MKRLWIGISILALLLASGWAIAIYTEQAFQPISRDLALASEAALAMDQTEAERLAGQAYANWLRCRDFTSAVADHAALEEINSLFGEVWVYAAAEDMVSFSAVCAYLSGVTHAVAESHQAIWQNLL